MNIIEISNLSLGYEGNKVIKKLNLDIKKNDYICLIGDNGSGKTTLIKGLLGLLKPTTGKIKLNGIKQNEIGYVPQITSNQKDFPASVFEVVLSGTINQLGYKPFYTSKEKNIAIDALKILEIENIKNKSFMELSGGQRQRVLIARSLCATRKVLVLDEPASGLDKKSSEFLYKTITKLHEKGITIIMITHDIEAAHNYASKVYEIKNGEAIKPEKGSLL